MSRAIQLPPAPVALLGGLAGAFASLRVYNALPTEQKWPVNILIGLYLLLFAWAAASIYQTKFLQKPTGWLNRIAGKTGQHPIQLLYLLLAVLAALTACLATGMNNFVAADFWVMLLSWLAGMLLAVLGSWQPGEHLPKASRRTWLICAGLFAVSFAIRVIAAGRIPPLLNGDEASAGLSAVRFIQDDINNIFGVGWFSFPAMYYALQSVFIRLLGQTTFALRFSSALIGSLTVPAVYLIGKRIYSHRAGLLAALFLAGSHFHQHFSRIGLNNIWDAFWYVLVLGLLVDAWRNRRRQSYLYAGLALGLAQYFYVSSRFLLIIIPVWLLAVAISSRRRWRDNRHHLLYFLLVFLVAAAPSIWYYAHDPGLTNFMAPFNRVDMLGDWLTNESEILGKPGWQILAGHLYDSARTFVSLPTQIWYPSRVPILRPVSAVLFIAGLILLLFKLYKPPSLLLFLWLGMFVVVGGLSIPVSAAQRYVAAIPACALVIGYALDETLRLIQRVQEKTAAENIHLAQKWMTAAAVLLVAGIGISNVYFYIFTYTPQSDLGGPNTLVAQRLAEYLQTQEPMQVAFFGGDRMGYYSINSTAYLAPHIEGLDIWQPWGSPENPPITSETVAFVFLPEVWDTLKLVRQDYPNGQLTIKMDNQGNPLYYLYQAENPDLSK